MGRRAEASVNLQVRILPPPPNFKDWPGVGQLASEVGRGLVSEILVFHRANKFRKESEMKKEAAMLTS